MKLKSLLAPLFYLAVLLALVAFTTFDYKLPADVRPMNTVLLAFKSNANTFERRMLIRLTIAKYADSFTGVKVVFYVSKPSSLRKKLLIAEMEKFGDIICLDHLEENRRISTSVKAYELFKYLRIHDTRFDWVVHLDDDSVLNVHQLMVEYLQNPKIPPKMSIFSRFLGKDYDDRLDFNYPGGMLYGLTWDAMEMVIDNIYAAFPDYATDGSYYEEDDLSIGLLLYRIGRSSDLRWIHMNVQQSFDINWSVSAESRNESCRQEACDHTFSKDTIVAHRVKETDDYILALNMFDVNGFSHY